MKRFFKKSLFLTISVLLLIYSCQKNDSVTFKPISLESSELATKWADLTLNTMVYSFYKSPTYLSRCLGYMGLTMYECVVHADSSQRSLAGQLNGLYNLPQPVNGTDYYWPLVLHAGQDALLRLLIPYPDDLAPLSQSYLDSVSKKIEGEESAGIPKFIALRSEKLGREIATAIYEWSKTDGGDQGFMRNFDPSYTFPTGNSFWVPPVGGQTVSSYPLHPFWGNNRPFVPANNAIPVPSIVPYSTDTTSDYYKMYRDVDLKNRILTTEEIDIAAWWSDDPSESYSPPGHSYNLATIAIKKSKVGLVKAAEAYARSGMAVADAFINCWKAKVKYFNERPSSYVRSNIDSFWVQYWPEPPFPAFPSGHSTQAAANAIVLAGLFGDNFTFVDNTNEGGWRFKPISRQLLFTRSFNNFWKSAVETGYSRILGGIHTKQDNETGLAEGKLVGENINNLNWKN
ncbi:MAG: vanadium-dependent haloperoxidase [Bacteroidota bacterium]